MDFGIISAKKIIIIVKIAVAKPTLNPCLIAVVVTKAGRMILAILLPINIPVMYSLGWDRRSNNLPDFLSPFLARDCNLILLVDVRAVSLPEKKKEINNKKMIAMITKTSSRSEERRVGKKE